jgi:DNA-binding MarR family transcriptional regulator
MARTSRAAAPADDDLAPVVDIQNYVPAFLTWIANKLSRGASQHYLAVFDTGIETWRCLVLLAIHGSITAQQVSKTIGMDKASVSRCFKTMQARGLITMSLDSQDGRLRTATLTAKGRALHDRILGVALVREQALLAVLSQAEQATLIGLLRRLHDNLPAVEAATARHVAEHYPAARRKAAARSSPSKEPTRGRR